MTETKILNYLIENNSLKFTINQISKNLNISYKIVHEIISRFENENLVNVEKVGASKLVCFNFNFSEKVLKSEISRRDDMLKNKDLQIILKRILSVNYPFMSVLLFGSFVKKKNVKGSDIDICVICDNEKIINKIVHELNLIPIDIHLNDFTVEEFTSMIKLNTFNVGNEIKKLNVILFGVENYYNLIGDVKDGR